MLLRIPSAYFLVFCVIFHSSLQSSEASPSSSSNKLILSSVVIGSGVVAYLCNQQKKKRVQGRLAYRAIGHNLSIPVYEMRDIANRKDYSDVVTIFSHGQGGDRYHGESYHANNNGPFSGPM